MNSRRMAQVMKARLIARTACTVQTRMEPNLLESSLKYVNCDRFCVPPHKERCAIAQAIAAAGVNMTFFVAQAVGRKFSAVLGFETEEGAKTAAPLIKKAATKRK